MNIYQLRIDQLTLNAQFDEILAYAADPVRGQRLSDLLDQTPLEELITLSVLENLDGHAIALQITSRVLDLIRLGIK